MDDAEIVDLDWLLRTENASRFQKNQPYWMSSTVERCDHNTSIRVILYDIVISTDLGSSSKYSSEREKEISFCDVKLED